MYAGRAGMGIGAGACIVGVDVGSGSFVGGMDEGIAGGAAELLQDEAMNRKLQSARRRMCWRMVLSQEQAGFYEHFTPAKQRANNRLLY